MTTASTGSSDGFAGAAKTAVEGLGLTGEQAAGAAKAFEGAMQNALGSGVPVDQAAGKAQAAAAIEASFPTPEPASVPGKSMSSPQAAVETISTLPSDPAANSAFNQALGSALAKGQDMGTAMKSAMSAANSVSAPPPATAEGSLMGQMAGGGPAPAPAPSTSPSASQAPSAGTSTASGSNGGAGSSLAGTGTASSTTTAPGPAPAPAVAPEVAAGQKATAQALARGESPQSAIAAGERVKNMEVKAQAAKAADLADPARSVANGSTAALEKAAPSATEQKALAEALARGMSPEEAVKAAARSKEAAIFVEQARKADKADPAKAIANGSPEGMAALASTPEDERLASMAFARGGDAKAVSESLAKARALNEAGKKADETAAGRLAHGRMPEELEGPEASAAFAKAIAGGKSPTEAIELAMKAGLEAKTAKTAGGNGVQKGVAPSYELHPFWDQAARGAFNAAIQRGMNIADAEKLADDYAAKRALKAPAPSAVKELIDAGSVPKISIEGYEKLPGWARFDPATGALSISNAPAGALPLKARVDVGGRAFSYGIVEKKK